MKVIRGILAGISFGIISEAFGWLIYGLLFAKWGEQASHLSRPMESLTWRIGMPLADIINGLMIALAFALLYKGIPGTGLKKGLVFGLILWLIVGLAGQLFWYTMSPIPFMLLVAGWLQILIAMSLGGLAVSAIYGKSLESK
jgi:hypothetical protein